jgi:LPS export ABC transporter protein LptC
MKKRLSVPLLLCAALLVYAIVSPSPGLLQDTSPPPSAGRAPDSYAVAVTVDDYDEGGVLRDRTAADTLRRYTDEALVELDKPRRRSYADNGQWFASAETGALREASDVLTLLHDVKLRYTADNLRFLTEEMAINLRTRVAESRAPVRMWQSDNETSADRLYINLDSQVATLNGAVKTRYVPET